jgi:hypothetical protein
VRRGLRRTCQKLCRALWTFRKALVICTVCRTGLAQVPRSQSQEAHRSRARNLGGVPVEVRCHCLPTGVETHCLTRVLLGVGADTQQGSVAQWLSGVTSLRLKRIRNLCHRRRRGRQAIPGNQQKGFHAAGRPDAARLRDDGSSMTRPREDP